MRQGSKRTTKSLISRKFTSNDENEPARNQVTILPKRMAIGAEQVENEVHVASWLRCNWCVTE